MCVRSTAEHVSSKASRKGCKHSKETKNKIRASNRATALGRRMVMRDNTTTWAYPSDPDYPGLDVIHEKGWNIPKR